MTVRTTKSEIDVRSKLAELSKPTGVAGNALAEKDTVEQQQEFLGVGRRNQIINGDFQVSQRGDYAGGLTMVESTYWIDRWRTRVTNSINATATHTLNKVRMEVNANATGSIRIDQKIEIHNSEHLSYKDMTLSALVKSNSTNARLAVYHQGWDVRNTQSSGDGQWERLTLTFNTGSLSVGNEFSIQIGLDGVSSANVALYGGEYMEVKEVQLEFGTTASPFERRLYQDEYNLCQRYYQRFDADGQDYTNIGIAVGTTASGSTRWYVPIVLPGGRMRTDPALSFSAASDFRVTLQHSNSDNCSSISIGYGNPITPNLSVQAGSNVAGVIRMFGYSASTTAYLAFDAEL